MDRPTWTEGEDSCCRLIPSLAKEEMLWQSALVSVILPAVYEAAGRTWPPWNNFILAGKRSHFDFFTLEGLTWIDWATVVGLILTIVGFGITWWQLHRTRTARQAVNATRSELNETDATRRFNRSLPAFRALYDQARLAAIKKDEQELRKRLEAWSIKCSEAITQLEYFQEQRPPHRRSGPTDDQVAMAVHKLRSAQGKIGEALRKMDEQPDMEDLESGVRYALIAMREFSDIAAAIAEERRYLRKAS